MTTLTAPAPQAHPLDSAEKPISLFQLGALFVIRASYWSCRAGKLTTASMSTSRHLPS
jgi:hypothetical protein